ncbi:dTDP-4-dehydrorhamnose reductase [Halomicrobium salinisoli]|uniref:dTDP-4-dehydrorhamnose reductase n=1 Tax=Halomicrobium salinisoli TaxID=2878391 RepID=UPI001CF07D0B|nr:dTDP-4-dehydrorhamnose reductase [Halomicrobium salinisoli]
MLVLVVGANGLLGSNVVQACKDRDWECCGTYHSTEPEFDVPLTQFDIRNRDAFVELLDTFQPDVVVNCAAMTDVDGCEDDSEAAHAINADAPGAMAEECDRNDVPFVHVSTDYVFDGTSRDPITESATPNPCQVYGESKLAGEQTVRDGADDALVLRLSFVWGIHRSRSSLTGFPAWVRGRLQSGETVPLFTDQWITPTRAGHAAETILSLVDREATGLYHVASRSCVTPHEFGALLADELDHDAALLEEGSIADVDRAATRPRYTCLDVSKLEDELSRSQPTLREDIQAVREEL